MNVDNINEIIYTTWKTLLFVCMREYCVLSMLASKDPHSPQTGKYWLGEITINYLLSSDFFLPCARELP